MLHFAPSIHQIDKILRFPWVLPPLISKKATTEIWKANEKIELSVWFLTNGFLYDKLLECHLVTDFITSYQRTEFFEKEATSNLIDTNKAVIQGDWRFSDMFKNN